MRTKKRSSERIHPFKEGPTIKTLELQFGVACRNLEERVRRAFVLAKSGGRELDLIFRSRDSS